MDSGWLQIMHQVPALAIFAGLMYFIVKRFMEYMTFRDKLCHEVQDRSTKAINDNTHVLAQVKEALRTINGKRKDVN